MKEKIEKSTKSIYIHTPESVWQEVKARADKNMRSISSEAVLLLKAGLKVKP